MADRITPKQRSRTMSKVKNKDTGIEIRIRSELHKKGFRFRKNVSNLPGTPDIVLPKYKTVIFVHGCFWHQHDGCPKSGRPKSNIEFWNDKLDKNVDRDGRNIETLKSMGWKVLLVWECELKDTENLIEKLTQDIYQ